MENEVIGLKLHVMKEVSSLSFVENVFDYGEFLFRLACVLICGIHHLNKVRFVFVPNAVQFVTFSNHHEGHASEHLGDKEEGLEDEPILNAGGFSDVIVDEPNHVRNIQDWVETQTPNHNLASTCSSLPALLLQLRLREL